jgi:hypothetical protein
MIVDMRRYVGLRYIYLKYFKYNLTAVMQCRNGDMWFTHVKIPVYKNRFPINIIKKNLKNYYSFIKN